MNKDQIDKLLIKYESGTCTDEEKALLETWFLKQHTTQLPSPREIEADLDEVWAGLNENYQQQTKKHTWYRVAAAILLFLSVAGFFLMKQKPAAVQQVAQNKRRHEILPGSNKAILTLANGKKIILNNAANGQLAQQAGVQVTKTNNGQVVYAAINVDANSIADSYNTIETPIGGQYRVTLPDGTNVWLNAASTLRYPVIFKGNERRVELTGEAYFEVAHNKNIPFRVVNARQTVEVLGTHFNINAYNDEAVVKTTLLEGSVKVSDKNHSQTLIPGQQSEVTAAAIHVINDAELNDAVAWCDGKIQFTDTNIETIMRMLSRWYNIDVQYKGEKINTSFGGSVSRSKNLSAILKVLESTGDVHFTIEGRRVTVMP